MLESTYPNELTFSGIREGLNSFVVLEVSKQSDNFEDKCQNREFLENNTIDVSHGPVRIRFNQKFPENVVFKA